MWIHCTGQIANLGICSMSSVKNQKWRRLCKSLLISLGMPAGTTLLHNPVRNFETKTVVIHVAYHLLVAAHLNLS